MRGWWWRIALVLLAVAPIAASGDTAATILSATPGVDGTAVTRFTMRFSEAMAPVGGGTAPIGMTCKVAGTGRWTDPQTYVWDYAAPLPGGTRCTAELVKGLTTLAGHDVTGARRFVIDAGGPTARAILPESGGSAIEEDQTFFVAANGPVDRASVAAEAYCAVDGIGERIPVDLLAADTPAQIFARMPTYAVSAMLESAALPNPLPTDAHGRAAALANIVALKCRRPLPPGRDMALVWAGSIHSPAGRVAGADRRFDFTVRQAFSAKLTCGRVNPRSGCDPVEPIQVAFTAPVAREAALAARLDVGGGRLIAPSATEHEATVNVVSFKPPVPPAITARLILPARLTDISGRPLANARRFPLDVAIAEAPPLVKFAAPFGILEAREGGVLPLSVRAVEPSLGAGVKTIAGGAARIEGGDGAVADWLRRVTKAQDDDIRDVGAGAAKRQVNHTGDTPILAGAAAHPLRLALPGGGKPFEVIGVPLAKPGFYVVELASPVLGQALLGRAATRYVDAAALVTGMAVHFKWGRGTSLAWVTALDSGKPVAGAQVRITDSCTGRELATGLTDAVGRVLVLPGLPAPSMRETCDDDGDAPESPPLMISARKDGDFSFAMTSWRQGIAPDDFDLPYGYAAPDPILHAIFDRTLLRAGETIHMKLVYRTPTATGLRSGGALAGAIVLQHRGSQTSFTLPARIGADGIGVLDWQAPKGAPTGDYDLTFQTGAGDDARSIAIGQSFRVDEYRLPSMRASVSGPRAPAVRPEQLPVDLYVGYLSGGGAAHASVSLRTAYEALSDTPEGWDGWSFGGGAVAEGTVALDEDQNDIQPAVLPAAGTIPVRLDAHGARRTTVFVPPLQDSATLRMEMDYQDANGETLTASTALPLYTAAVRLGIKTDGWLQRATDLRLKIAAIGTNGKAIAGQRVTVALFTREILSARRRLIGGFYAFDNSARTTRIAARCTTSTDAHGLAWCRLDAGVSGEVIAVATTTDAAGNAARAVTSTYLAGDDDWWFGGDNGDRIDIVPDQKAYHPGDTAHVQVRMPFRAATALVTVEREGVMSSFVTTISGKDPIVDVPMTGVDAPDAYISVMAVRGRIAGWRLWLADLARRWHLPFFSRDGAYPTALVDLAKPSYRIGIAKVTVGWDTHRLRVAVATDREHYHVRDRVRVGIAVRGPDGCPPREAEVAVMAVDEALLQLSPNDSTDLLGAMMGERPLSVLTSTGQMQVVGKRHYGRKALAAGGGGGGGDLSALTRADFRPVLLWRGRVRLNAKGEAATIVPLVDSLSSYKIVAVATAGADLFGSGSARIRTVQDLTVYAGVPPLVRAGDLYGAVFTLRNGGDRAMTVTAAVDLQPAVARGRPLTVTIPAGGAVPVQWRLTAPEHVAALRWVVSAKTSDGRAADRVQVDEALVPAVPEQVWGADFVQIRNGLTVPVAPPPGALAGRGGVEVALTASPAPPLAGVMAYMRAYPYGCFEQRLSRAVALDDRAAWGRQVADLPTYQDDDGLLRYWPVAGTPGSIALTAYAVSMTAEAGLPWPGAGKAKAIGALRGVVDGRIAEAGQGPADARLLRLAALAALARNGASTSAMLGQAAMPLADMPTATLADWLVTLDRTPGADAASRARAEAALRGRIVYAGTRLDLVDKAVAPWWMMVSDDEMALKALLAVTGRPGWAADAPRMMIGVAMRQQQGHWDTTPANAWGTIAARRIAAAFPATATGTTTARLAGRTATASWPSPALLRFPLPTAAAPLLLRHSAAPGPWATVSVRAAVPLARPAFAGYRVSRQVSFVERRRPDRVSSGDVLKVRITVDAPVDRTWVVVEDPIPAGASIVGGDGGQSALLAAQAGGDVPPDYVEPGLDAWRGYFGWLAKGRTSVAYVVRVNGAGRFLLPPTRVEAMYSPDIHAELPNRPLVVW